MFKATITFRIKQGHFEQASQDVWSLSGALLHSGQLLPHHLLTSRARQRILLLTGIVHEEVSLSPGSFTSDSRKAWHGFQRHLSTRPRITLEPLLESRRTCACSKPGQTIFDPVAVDVASPLCCTRCRGRVPLYRFRHLVEGPHPFGGLLQVEHQWQGTYWMWLDSSQTEKLGWEQLADPRSDLNRFAIREVRRFEKETGQPVYYELFSHYGQGSDGPESTLCPGCGRNWDKSGKIAELACHRCRLTSALPVDLDLPRWWQPLPLHRREWRGHREYRRRLARSWRRILSEFARVQRQIRRRSR